MASSIPAFPASELPRKVQIAVTGKKRKLADGRTQVDLRRDCELMQMMQYSCKVERPCEKDSPVNCWPMPRLFRRCQDKNGSFMVETTAWEGFPGCPADNPPPASREKSTADNGVVATVKGYLGSNE